VPLPEPFRSRCGPGLERIAAVVASAMRDMAAALVARRAPPPLDAVERSLDEFAELFAALRRDGFTLNLSMDVAERIFLLGFAFEQLRQHLLDLDRCLREAAQAR
jgi:hypothetical protein